MKIAFPAIKQFQYQKGAIKTRLSVEHSARPELGFQYQKGAIKTTEDAMKKWIVEAFQYQKGAIKTACAAVFRTNQIRAFQYQKGAIKTVLRCASACTSGALSIPKRCD